MARRSNGRIRHEGLPPQLPLTEVLPLCVGGCHSRSADIPLTPQGAVGPGENVVVGFVPGKCKVRNRQRRAHSPPPRSGRSETRLVISATKLEIRIPEIGSMWNPEKESKASGHRGFAVGNCDDKCDHYDMASPLDKDRARACPKAAINALACSLAHDLYLLLQQ